MDFERFHREIRLEIFYYLSARDLFVCSAVCRSWKKFLDGDGEDESIWSDVLESSTPVQFRNCPQLKTLSARRKLVIFDNTWNKTDISPNVHVKENMITTHRNPVAQSSDMAKGKRGYLKGHHYWTIVWHGPKLGSNAVVGVATDAERINGNGYFSLVGSTCESWGWDLSNGVLRHNGDLGTFPDPKIGVKMDVGVTIGVILDMDKRTLSFELEGRCLGVAFRDLPPQRLYPAVSMVYAHTEVSLLYQGQPLEG